jgi:hypothetical protein
MQRRPVGTRVGKVQNNGSDLVMPTKIDDGPMF